MRDLSVRFRPALSGLPWLFFSLGLLVLPSCQSAGSVPIGGTCNVSTECQGSACMEGVCVDPAADPDGDGLVNGVEILLGSDGDLKDTDNDAILDPDELGPDMGLIDTDGDGKADVIESAIADADGDCITDQFDAEDGVDNSDKSPMIAAVCPTEGLCGEQRDKLRASCPDGKTAICVFDDVVGYSAVEVCDGRDDNCDGQVDEDFPDGCSSPATRFIAPGSGGRTVATSRYRATLVMGQPALDDATTARHRVILGGNPYVNPIAGARSTEP